MKALGTNRNGVFGFLAHIHPPKIPKDAAGLWPTLCLGGLSFGFFVVLIFTGFLLMPFYKPGSPSEALDSVLTIEEALAYGSFLRSLHFFAGQLMIIALVGHTLRVLASGAFAPPRRGNWLIGMSLLVLTFFLDFSGYLLIGDERAMDASRVAFGLLGEVPLLGGIFQALVFGADPVGQGAGLRLYALHCGVLPFLALGLCAWHFYRVRRDGGVSRGL